ncbi:hypothetical protein HYU16_03110 [Candidatus Woesearchaeota archaeon]|nr:hypothetical protein [Candidatus Woesearchaeota archaeon]
MSVGEYLVRGNLVAARVLNVLDGQNHYRDVITAEVADIKGATLEIIVGNQVRGPLNSNTANLFRQARQNLRPQVNRQLQTEEQQWDTVENFLRLIEQVMTGPADQTAYRQIQQHLNGLRGVGAVDVSINYAAVRADNTRLRHEAMQLAGRGEPAAEIVVQYLDDVARTRTGTIPTLGIESGVRDFFFIHNLLEGAGWGYVLSESGLLLEEGGKHREAIDDLVTAEHIFGYEDPAVYLGLGKAYQGIGSIDQAIGAFNAVLKDTLADQEANTALVRLYRQKAQTAKSVPTSVRNDVLESVMSTLTPESIRAAHISKEEKASQLYQLAVAYLTLEPQFPDEARQLLHESLALEPRRETYSWLAELHSRAASGELYAPFPARGHHGAGASQPSLFGRTGSAVGRILTMPIHVRTPVTIGRR